MTCFYNWLNEETLNDFLKNIKKDCKYYINLLNKYGITPFYRGIQKSKLKENFGKNKVNKNRKPLATKKEIFNEINEYFEEVGHARRDRSVIATSNKEWTQFFGIPTYIFPTGKFNYTFVKTYDFNKLKYLDRAPKLLNDFLLNNLKKDEDIDKALEILNEWLITNKLIDYAYDEGWEIWFDSNEYYYLVADEYNKIKLMNNLNKK